MKISHVTIRNILGVDSLEFTPEGFNTISGPNGTGKTSILEAIKSVFEGGTDATLLRKGAEKGEIVLVLDDGTEVHKRVTATRSTTDVVRDGKKITRPSDAIRALTDLLSVNPVEFLRATKKDRVKVLLESMPIAVDTVRLAEISGVAIAPGTATENPLALIDAVRKQVFDDRTGTNRAVREKESTINQLRVAMPDAPGGVEGDEDELRGKVEAARQVRDAELTRVNDKLQGIMDASAAKQQALKDEAQAKIDAIKVELQEALDTETARIDGIKEKARVQRDLARSRFDEASMPLNAAIAAIVADRDAAAKRKATAETIAQMELDLADLEEDAKTQTAALDAIDAYKAQLLAELPIPGLTVQDGEVYRDGVAFDRLNTAQQVEIAFEIAKLRAGELAVCCIDGCELLDSEHLAELERQAHASGLQVFVTKVSDEEFSVRTQ